MKFAGRRLLLKTLSVTSFTLLNALCTSLSQFKQRLQRTNKLGSKSSQTYGRQSPIHGVRSALQHSQTQTRMVQSSAIPIPTVSRPSEGPQRRSLEGPNTEIQTLVPEPSYETQPGRVC